MALFETYCYGMVTDDYMNGDNLIRFEWNCKGIKIIAETTDDQVPALSPDEVASSLDGISYTAEDIAQASDKLSDFYSDGSMNIARIELSLDDMSTRSEDVYVKIKDPRLAQEWDDFSGGDDSMAREFVDSQGGWEQEDPLFVEDLEPQGDWKPVGSDLIAESLVRMQVLAGLIR